MKNRSTGFWLDFRRVFSRRVSGNKRSVLLELVVQPLVVAVLVFIAFLNHDKVDPYKLNFIYFSTLYAFWIGLFGSCQAINSEVRSGEWCYWVLGMGRNRTTHVLAIWTSCFLFAFVQCLFFLFVIVVLSEWSPGVGSEGTGKFNHFTDMFVRIPHPDGSASSSIDPIYQMNGVLWYVLTAQWGSLSPTLFASSIFTLSLFSALVAGTFVGLLFGSSFKEPATSLNMAVGFVVLLGMISFCGLRGDGEKEIDTSFAPLREVVSGNKYFTTNIIPAAKISYILPQRYFFNIGRMTFDKEWSGKDAVQKILREQITNCIEVATSRSLPKDSLRFKADWLRTMMGCNFDTNSGVVKWVNNYSEENLSKTDMECFKDWNQPEACEMVSFLRKHPEHRRGWAVALHRKTLLSAIGIEMLPILLINVLCLVGTLLSVWKKGCYQQLR